MISTTKTQAIQTALGGDWNTAIQLNEEVLKEEPEDVETLNRLAFCYTVVGKVKEAKNTYQKVLEIDRLNPIALKNLKKLNADKASNFSANAAVFSSHSLDTLFLEESGKTKIVDLVNISDPKILAHLITGESLQLRVKRLKIFVLDQKNQYIGVLPDNIGKRLIKFIKGGNTYEAYIKSADKNKVTVFVKETKRVSRFKNQPSFVVGEKMQLVLNKSVQNIAKQRHSELEDDENQDEDGDDSF